MASRPDIFSPPSPEAKRFLAGLQKLSRTAGTQAPRAKLPQRGGLLRQGTGLGKALSCNDVNKLLLLLHRFIACIKNEAPEECTN